MLKKIARSALKTLAKRAPLGARNALIQGICEGGGTGKVLSQLARNAHISTFMADGESGFIQSSSSDETLLPSYALSKTWAAPAVAFLRDAFADQPGTYIDVGANIGLTTIPIARNPKLRCVAFEPDPNNFWHLSENVRRNAQNGNIELVPMALMDKAGSVSLSLNKDGNPGDHRIVNGATHRETLEVRAVTLDEYLPDLNGRIVVKIDTQGAEPFVLAGGRKTLSKANAIVMEFWPYGMAQLGAQPDEIYALIKQFRTIAMARGEHGIEAQFNNPDDAVAALTQNFDVTKRREYWDIYLTR